jgi:hypothetical protein
LLLWLSVELRGKHILGLVTERLRQQATPTLHLQK